MRSAAAILLTLTLLSIGAEAQKIKVEFDKNADFTKFRTFAWGPRDASSRPMLVAAIAGAIEAELTARGLTRTTQHPDLYIQIYGSVDSDAVVSYTDLYSGYGGIPPFDQSFLMWGAAPGTTTTAIVHKGQLIVDLIAANQRKLVWRGIATEKLSESRKKLVKQVNTAAEKLFQKYPVEPISK